MYFVRRVIACHCFSNSVNKFSLLQENVLGVTLVFCMLVTNKKKSTFIAEALYIAYFNRKSLHLNFCDIKFLL